VSAAALMSYRMGDFQEAFNCAQKALNIYPNHGDSKELISLLQKMFASM
jgi:tetratricopeptide (TPR) repeat protein